MFSMLIVDDEAIAIRGIEAGIHFDKINISEIHKAYNVRQAKEIMKNNEIDILMSDIEMPKEDGLQLLEWVKTNSPGTETIFLTCHTDFDYARKALQLGCADYMLKSMSFPELETVIGKTVEKVEKKRMLLKTSAYGALWQKNQPYMIEQFWLDLANGNIPPDRAEIIKYTKDKGIDLYADMRIIPVLLQLIPGEKNTGEDQKKQIAELQDRIKTLLLNRVVDGYVLNLDHTAVLCVLQAEASSDDTGAKFSSAVNDPSVQQALSGIACYVGTETTPAGIADAVAQLKVMKKNNVTLKRGVFYLEDQVKRLASYNRSWMNTWSTLLAEGHYEKLAETVSQYFDDLTRIGNLDADALKQFHQDFLQLVYSALRQKNIEIHVLLNDAVSVSLFDKSTESLPDMMIFIKHILSRIKEYALSMEEVSIVDKVKRYVASHLNEDLNREELAGFVFLNPDYLTRLFKRETGMTLIEYFQCERIRYAKEMLENTDLSVSRIGEKLGYTNFSHFARMFKKNTGFSPVEYKRKSEAQRAHSAVS